MRIRRYLITQNLGYVIDVISIFFYLSIHYLIYHLSSIRSLLLRIWYFLLSNSSSTFLFKYGYILSPIGRATVGSDSLERSGHWQSKRKTTNLCIASSRQLSPQRCQRKETYQGVVLSVRGKRRRLRGLDKHVDTMYYGGSKQPRGEKEEISPS